MTNTTQFEQQFNSEFQGRFRIRWDARRGEYQIEQKVATGQILEPEPDPETGMVDTQSEDWLRARDGYMKVMAIRSGDRMPCPVCHTEVKVPIMETRGTTCWTCGHRYIAAYFPLNQVLIDRMRELDPENGGPERVKARMVARRGEREERIKRESLDDAGNAIMDDKYQVEHRPMTGYGPKTAQRGDETRFQ